MPRRILWWRSTPSCPAPSVTHVCALDYVATILGEDLELLEAIVWNDDNLSYGSIISVHTGPDETITALTDDGLEELRDMLRDAVHSGERRPAAARPRRSASRAVPSLYTRSSPPPPGARVAPAARAGRRWAAGIGPRVHLQNGFGSLARIGNEPFGLAQLLRGQAGKQAAAEGSAYLTAASEQSAN